MTRFLNDKDGLSINTPHCSVLVYNYLSRTLSFGKNGNSPLSNNRLETDENSVSSFQSMIDDIEIIKLDSHILSVNTQKSKYNNSGSFRITLSPAINWAGRITSGSWVVILMASNTDIKQKDYKYANEKLFKFVGQIRAVTQNVQWSKGRVTSYTISGSDWGEVFNDTSYYSEFLKMDGIQSNIAGYNIIAENVTTIFNGGSTISDSSNTDMVVDKFLNVHEQINNFIKKAWATTNSQLGNLSSGVKDLLKDEIVKDTEIKPDTLIHPFFTFTIPKELRRFLRLPVNLGTNLFPMVNLFIKVKAFDDPGKTLDTFDVYKIPEMGDLLASRSVWSILNTITEPNFFEMYPEISWKAIDISGANKEGGFLGEAVSTIEKHGNPLKELKDKINKETDEFMIPQFCLYHRPKPFAINDVFGKSSDISPAYKKLEGTKKNISKMTDATKGANLEGYATTLVRNFVDLDYTIIDELDIITVDSAYNWDAKINFIEITNTAASTLNLSGPLRFFSQNFDRGSFLREGFRPMSVHSSIIPFDPKAVIQQQKQLKDRESDKKMSDLAKQKKESTKNSIGNYGLNILNGLEKKTQTMVNGKLQDITNDVNSEISKVNGITAMPGKAVTTLVNGADKLNNMLSTPCASNLTKGLKSVTSLNLSIDSIKTPSLDLGSLFDPINGKISLMSTNLGDKLSKLGAAKQSPTIKANKALSSLSGQQAKALSSVNGQAKALKDKAASAVKCAKSKKADLIESIIKDKSMVWADALLTVGFRSYSILLGEWFFNLHRMLSGSIRIKGQDGYIEVGTNILFDIRVIDFSQNLARYMNNNSILKNKDLIGTYKKQIKESFSNFINGEEKHYLLAHVEDISHSFSNLDNGSRIFISDIRFSRGIIVTLDENNRPDPAKTEKGEVIYALDLSLNRAAYSKGDIFSSGDNPYNANMVFEYQNEREDLQDTENAFGIESDIGEPDVEKYITEEYEDITKWDTSSLSKERIGSAFSSGIKFPK